MHSQRGLAVLRAFVAALCFIASPVIADTLTVTKGGSGSGTMASSVGDIDCGSMCSDDFANATSITLTATRTAGNQFTGWLGRCTGTAPCSFAINGNANVVATFAPSAMGPPTRGHDINPASRHSCYRLTRSAPHVTEKCVGN